MVLGFYFPGKYSEHLCWLYELVLAAGKQKCILSPTLRINIRKSMIHKLQKKWLSTFFVKYKILLTCDDFPGKESPCNAGDPGSIPGSGRSPGEGNGCPLQYSWTSLVTQMVKNPPAMQETWVWSWVGKIPWRRERLPTPIFWPGEVHGQRSLVGYSPWGFKETDTTERLSPEQHSSVWHLFYECGLVSGIQWH